MYNPTSLGVFLIAFLANHEFNIQKQLVAAEEALTAKDEFLLTHEQKKDLKKLKELVMDSLIADYMKSELYLVRRFRDQNFDVNKTAQAINETLKMRVEYAMDGILFEDWSAYDKKFEQWDDIEDRKGRPVWYGLAQNWFIAPELEGGNFRNMTRYVLYRLESVVVKSIRTYEETKKIARYIVLIDWHNVPILSITCPLCIPFGKEIFKVASTYPYFMFRSVNVNVPPLVENFMNAITAGITEEMKSLVVRFNPDAAIWRKYLIDLMGSEDKIPTQFFTGGVNPADPTGGNAESFSRGGGPSMSSLTGIAAAPAVMSGGMPPPPPPPTGPF